MSNFKHLVKYFELCDSDETPSSTSTLLALSLLSSLCSRVYRIDGFAPDIHMISNDDTDLIRAKLRTIEKEAKRLGLSFNSSVKAQHIAREAIKNKSTSVLYVLDFGSVRNRADNEQRRKMLGDLSKSNEALNAIIEGVIYKIDNPAAHSIVLDTREIIENYMNKNGRDNGMDRYIFDISKRLDDINAIEYSRKPPIEVIEYLNDINDVVNTLFKASVSIDVPMSARARNHYDQEMLNLASGAHTYNDIVDVYRKVKKLAALFALSRSIHDAVIDVRDVSASIEMVRNERDFMVKTEEDLGDARAAALYDRLCLYLSQPYGSPGSAASRNSKPHLHALGMVPVSHMLQAIGGVKLFAKDSTFTKKELLDRAVDALIQSGKLRLLHSYHPLSMGGERGRIFSRIAYVAGFALDRVNEWIDLPPVYDV